MSDDKKISLLKRIQNLAEHKAFLLTQLLTPGPTKVMEEECGLLGKMRESLEKDKKQKQEAEYGRKTFGPCEKRI